jgi:acetate kinase
LVVAALNRDQGKLVLSLNSGSSSVKYSLFCMGLQEIRLARGEIERIGSPDSRLIQESPKGKVDYPVQANDHSQAIHLMMEALTDREKGSLPSLKHILAVGHRVVHGGEVFADSSRIDPGVIKTIGDLSPLAPLHNPPNLAGIDAIDRILPQVPQVAVFDTAFHQTLPPYAYLYALPYQFYEKYRIRRYGFHGISHRYVMEEATGLLGRPAEDLRLITCHLGNGSSIAAIKGGRSVDTSMGFTPLEGMPMGTRCGDIDPAIVLFLLEKEGLDTGQAYELLNKESGMGGVSCYSQDMREIIEAVYADVPGRVLNVSHPHHQRSKLALEIFIYRLKKYIGAYAAAMGGVDALVFTGGIGQNSALVPEESCAGLQFMGVEIGPFKRLGKGCIELSTSHSRVKVLVVPTDEELMIARETLKVLQHS